MVDGLGVGDVGNIVLRDRQHLAEDGIIIVVLTLEGGSGQVLAGPDIVSRGFVYVRGAEGLMDDAKHLLDDTMQHCMDKGITDWGKIKTEIKDSLGDFVLERDEETPDDYADNYGSVEDYEMEQSRFQICQYQLFHPGCTACCGGTD